jgi:ribosomal protein L22
MVEENKPATEKKQEGKKKPTEKQAEEKKITKVPKPEKPAEAPKNEEKKEEKVVENKAETKPKTPEKKTKKVLGEARVLGKDLPISTKHAIAVCNFIRNRDIDVAIQLLGQAEKMKIPIPMKGEIPHRKGIMSGRYPVNAIKHFIRLLKSLKANAVASDLELEKYKIFCKSDVAARPYKRFGRGRFKRTNVLIKLIPITKE